MGDKPDQNNAGSEAPAKPQVVPPEAPEAASPETPEQRLAAMEDKFLRVSAELENVRKRSARDVENARKFALESCLTELTPVLDSLEQARDGDRGGGAEQADGEGIEMCYRLFLSTLEKFGVRQLNPLGENFNPDEHEAIAMIPNPDAKPGVVLEVFQSGYVLNDRLVRAAKVVVAQAVQEPQVAQQPQAEQQSKTSKAKPVEKKAGKGKKST